MNDISDILDYFINFKRIFYNRPYIPKPKAGTQDYTNLKLLGEILDERGIPFEEYLLVQIKAYQRRNVFPSSAQLLGIKAINRYNNYKRRNFRIGQTFKADSTSVVIYATGMYYTIEEFTKQFNQDLKAMMIFAFVKENKVNFEQGKAKKIKDCLEYLVAKYEFFNQQPPESLLKWKEVLYETNKE